MAMLNNQRVNQVFLWQLSIANCKKLPEGNYIVTMCDIVFPRYGKIGS